jgi:hypothetical protein
MLAYSLGTMACESWQSATNFGPSSRMEQGSILAMAQASICIAECCELPSRF